MRSYAVVVSMFLSLIFMGCGGGKREAFNPPPPQKQWVVQATGSLVQSRDGHTATLLPDGKVLVVGGEVQGVRLANALASAELFDPATETWSPAGSLVNQRLRHNAVLLPTGKVIILGGWNLVDGNGKTGVLAVEEWDPSTKAFRIIGSLLHDHPGGQAFLRQDGRIQVVGGYDSNLPVTSDTYLTEIFDPMSGTSQLDFPLYELESNASLLPIDSSHFMLLGGENGLGYWHQLDSVYLYATDGSQPNPSYGGRMPAAFAGNPAVKLPTGKAVVGGGYDQYRGGATDTICVIDYAHPGSTILSTKLQKVRMGHQLIVMDDGNVVFVAGETFTGQISTTYLSDIEILNLQTMRTAIIPATLHTPRTNHTLTKLQDGSYLIAGGYNYPINYWASISSCERLIYR
jgi:hypothetical protein